MDTEVRLPGFSSFQYFKIVTSLLLSHFVDLVAWSIASCKRSLENEAVSPNGLVFKISVLKEKGE